MPHKTERHSSSNLKHRSLNSFHFSDSNDQIGSPQTEYQEEQQPVECAHSPEGSNAGRNIRRTRSRWIPTLGKHKSCCYVHSYII